jgi:ribosome-associated toxin RatA of RatAB toxin-antitoxin module
MGENEMTKIERSIVIHRPLEEVFNFVSDAKYTSEWFPWIVESGIISPGPYGIGTVEYEIVNQFYLFRKIKNICKVTNYQPNRIIERNIKTPAFLPWSSKFLYEPVEGGTKLTYTITWKPIGFYKLFNSFFVILFTLMDLIIPLSRLKSLMESQNKKHDK